MRTGSKSGRELSEADPKTCPGLVSGDAGDSDDHSWFRFLERLKFCSGVEPDLVDLFLRISRQRIPDLLNRSSGHLEMCHPNTGFVAGDLEHFRAEVLRVVRT